jgi:chromosome segregation ATPase
VIYGAQKGGLWGLCTGKGCTNVQQSQMQLTLEQQISDVNKKIRNVKDYLSDMSEAYNRYGSIGYLEYKNLYNQKERELKQLENKLKYLQSRRVDAQQRSGMFRAYVNRGTSGA